ncbi:MAG: SDR family NAD(P)-dependent oxidoreductase [Eubacteriales bacterium]|nr:SDR family NAD(P)-dependent oxidoreductase [Eubacteriales bacterium]
MISLKGKTLIVTGAGSGMGRELTLKLIKMGTSIAACDINKKTLEDTATLAASPKHIRTYVLNVADQERAAAFPSMVKKDFGALHGIINNAGIIQPFVKIPELTDETITRVMNVNFSGIVTLSRAVMKELTIDADTFIVNVSSMGGFLPVPGQAVYGASKAAVKLFTEALYGEMQGTRTHVSVVFPGAIATNISDSITQNDAGESHQNKDDMQYRTTPADKAADTIIRGIEQGKLRIFVGNDAKMMDKLYRLIPTRAIDMMAKRIGKMMKKEA